MEMTFTGTSVIFKGLLHPKMEMLSLITYPSMSFQICKSFVLTTLWQMDYFDNVFHTFLGLDKVDSVIYSAVNGTVTNLSCFHPKYLKFSSKDELIFYLFGTT